MIEFWKLPIGVHPNNLPGERSRQGLAIAVKRLNEKAGGEFVRFIPGVLPDKSDCQIEVIRQFDGEFFPVWLVCRVALDTVSDGGVFTLEMTDEQAKRCRSEIRSQGWALYVSKSGGGYLFGMAKPKRSGFIYEALSAIGAGATSAAVPVSDLGRLPYFRVLVSQYAKKQGVRLSATFDPVAVVLTVKRLADAPSKGVDSAKVDASVSMLPNLSEADFLKVSLAVQAEKLRRNLAADTGAFDFENGVEEII